MFCNLITYGAIFESLCRDVSSRMTNTETHDSHSPSLIENAWRFVIAELRDQYTVIFPSTLSIPIQHQRMDIMQVRIRAIAWLLAFAMPLWSLIDAVAFPHDVWTSMLVARLLAGAGFASFLLIENLLRVKGARGFWMLHAQIAIIFAIPTLFYFFCPLPLEPSGDAHPFAAAIAFSYYLLPFIIFTGIGLFPLTLLEAVGFAVPLLAIYTLGNLYFPSVHSPLSSMGTLWIMAVVAVISILVSISQLRLLIALVTYSAYDVLTDCLSRRSGEEIVKTLWNYSLRQKMNLSIAFIDLDKFKTINDNFGHRVGDSVLANAAATIKQSARKSDFVIRWGGEEFLIIMTDTDIENATAVLTRLSRNGFGQRPDGDVQTASIGLAERIADDMQDEKQLIELADQRLYQAKAAGRNRCIGSKVVILR